MKTRNAFTLVELVVALVILVILSSIAAFSLSGTMDRYQLTRATETIEIFDARARRDARLSGQSLQTRIDTGRGELHIESTSSPRGANASRPTRTFRLPSNVVIQDIQLAKKVVIGRTFDTNINPQGQGVSYAVHLARGRMSRWLVILGTSGQTIEVQDQREANEILSL